MKDASTLRTVRLTSYLIEQGVGSDPKAQGAIFKKIHSGVLPAVITVHPELPPGASTRDIYSYAESKAREVSVLDSPRAKAEVMKAALGRDADWTVLDRLSVRVPDGAPTRKTIVKPIQREAANRTNILDAIRALGYSPTDLPPRENGKVGIKREVRDYLRKEGISIGDGAFNKAWSALSKERSIKES